MEVQRQFRLVLPSNASAHEFHENTIGNYTTKLHSRLHFDGDWEVALTAISYTLSWYNLPQDCEISLVNDKKERQNNGKAIVEAGFYNSPSDLVEKINTQLRGMKGLDLRKPTPRLSLHPESNKVTPESATVGANKLYPFFDRMLMNILGLRDPSLPTTVSQRYDGETSDLVTLNAKVMLTTNSIVTLVDANGEHIDNNEIKLMTEYISLEALLRDINFKSHAIYRNKWPKLVYKTLNNREPNKGIIWQIPGELDSKKTYLSFDANVMGVLGFRPANHEINLESFYSNLTPYAADVFAGFRQLYIYCDLVDLSSVGDGIVPLLRTVEVPTGKKFGNQVDLEPKTKIYIPLNKSIVDTIEIDIRDDTGQPLSFEFGRVTVTLHFRRRQ